MGSQGHFNIDLTDEVVRGAIVVHKGEILSPAPRPSPPAPVQAKVDVKAEEVKAITPWQKTVREVAAVTGISLKSISLF
jgi:H+-translocating NAD(P) transhydrogenase